MLRLFICRSDPPLPSPYSFKPPPFFLRNANYYVCLHIYSGVHEPFNVIYFHSESLCKNMLSLFSFLFFRADDDSRQSCQRHHHTWLPELFLAEPNQLSLRCDISGPPAKNRKPLQEISMQSLEKESLTPQFPKYSLSE